ncbi:MAG: hypothetical protein AVO35_05575 [Candidatus Aegiribacteria sp. MLS_C]|nr:MAG: hypothetical protein AVO35_05575 [Candidatus Aegiribacteria sp. MLS_C]
MGKNELAQVLDVVYRAILRETVSFNYYYRASNDPSLPDGVRGLLGKLAEEERGHRKILLKEYTAIQKGWSGRGQHSSEEGSISYSIPEDPEFLSLPAPVQLDVEAVSLPSRLVGGDHILGRVAESGEGSGGGLFLILYDAMGHGIETTRFNSAAASILGEYLDATSSADAETEILSPSRAVTRLNADFSGQFQGSGVFLTLVAVYIDPVGGVLKYSIAGHEPPLIIRSDGTMESLYYTQLLIGIDQERRYMEYSVPFTQGDRLCVFSDGILEARNSAGEFYGRHRLNRVLAGCSERSAKEIVNRILADLREFCGDETLEDEVSVAVVGCCGT